MGTSVHKQETEMANCELESLWSSIPSELALRIISELPSPLLFNCRTLSKAFHACALQILSRRPFFVYQRPSSECFLLPLDALSTPLLSTFKLGTSSFTLFSTSSNLICLKRSYASMLDVRVCSIFCKWKVTLPPIVHPDYAPRLLRRVFTEDSNVDSMKLIFFEALPNESTESSDGHGSESFLNEHDPQKSAHALVHAPGSQLPCNVCLGYHNFRIVAANNIYARVFDSHRQAWSDPIYQLADIRAPALPQFMVGGFPVKFDFNDRELKLRISFPHVEGVSSSTATHGLVVEGMCEKGRSPSQMSFVISSEHRHNYTRENLYKDVYDFESKLYFLVIEKERILCYKRGRPKQQRHVPFHTIQPEDVETYVRPPEGSDEDFACEKKFPASTPCTLTLYVADVDTINWTMRLQKENATALLKLSKMWDIPYQGMPVNMGEFLLIKGLAS